MAQISRFFGIIIWMYYNDHNPPHFHACYGDEEVEINIKTLEIIQGSISPRVLGLIMEWALIHKNELLENWDRLHNSIVAEKIEPLK